MPVVSSCKYTPFLLSINNSIWTQFSALASIFLEAQTVARTSFTNSVTYPFKYYLQIVKKLDCEGSLWDPTGHFPKVDHFNCILFTPLYTFQSRWQGWEVYKHNSFPIQHRLYSIRQYEADSTATCSCQQKHHFPSLFQVVTSELTASFFHTDTDIYSLVSEKIEIQFNRW